MTDIDSLLFKIEMSHRSPQPGALLIAEPFLREDYFCHAVICLVDYEIGKRSMGIVMNKPTNYTLGTLVKQIDEHNITPIYCGGPLSCDRLYFIHTLGDIIPNSRKINDNLYIGGDFNAMIGYVNSGYNIEGNVRFFIGYSGWDSGQLEEELTLHTWAVSNQYQAQQLLMGEGDKYWHNHVKALGNEYRGWQYHPENPQLN